ncbi:hypothetical protein EON80_01380 [bacterium]|nr:MAG: hypothetical protein EON80_01380 [bacterium]
MAMNTTTMRREALVIRGISKAAVSWFIFSLGVQILAMLAIHIFSLNHGFGGLYPLASGHDDGYYFSLASDLARGGDAGVLPSFYPRILGALFYFTGPDLIVGKMLNVVAGAFSVMTGVLLARDLAREDALLGGRNELASNLAGERAANLAGFFLTFYPSQLWYSTQIVKDPILVFLGLWALLLGVRFLRRPSFGQGLLWLAAFCGLFVFRSYAAFALGVAVVLFTVRFRRKWLPFILVIAAIGPLAVGQGLFGWSQIQPWLDTQRLESFREVVYSTGGSAADIRLDFSNPLSFLLTYPYSFATVMFGPFPWQLRSAGQAIALVEAIAIWGLIGVWIRGFIEIWRGRPGGEHQGYASLLMLFSVLLLGSVALFSDNIGANTRLRLLPWCAFFVFAAVRMESLPIFNRLSLAQFLRFKRPFPRSS